MWSWTGELTAHGLSFFYYKSERAKRNGLEIIFNQCGHIDFNNLIFRMELCHVNNTMHTCQYFINLPQVTL